MNAVLRILSKFTKKYVDQKNSSKGYVLILLCFLTPVLLLGGRWVLEYTNRGKIFKDMKVEKRCAREVAMAVATSMNPGLKFTDQKETLIRIADKVYNEYPAYGDVGNPDAVPGLQSPIYETKKKGKDYDPSVLGIKKYQSFSPKVKQVPYQEASKYVYRYASDEDIGVGEVFRRVYLLKKDSRVMDECAIIDLLPYVNPDGKSVNVYSYCSFHKGEDTSEHISMKYLASSSSQQLQDPEYRERLNPEDETVQIAMDNDRIWAKTDMDTAYVTPAECNVDIVITVPTNMAACNKDNSNDLPTVLSEDTQSVVSSDTLSDNQVIKDFRSTPIYQIAQAYHYFLQHFLHTRGANVGLVPYSGKLSLPPDRAEEWTQLFPAFSWPDDKQNEYMYNLKGSFLYGTIGIKGTALNVPYETWGGYNLPEKHGGYGIIMRGNTLQEESYANNYICHGDLLDNSNPANYKFYRFNYNPCYITNISLMTMNSTEDSLQYCFNPYFVVELQADVAKIDDLMDVFVPFNDQNNNSNFTFLPLTWAHNLFQDWTTDPKQDDQASPEEFYRQSKLTPNRKKAIILVVNKPDWFEPNEMTYLGFNNDFSEMPFVESDCIRFDVQQTSSQKYADGTQKQTVDSPTETNRLYGQKKLLSFFVSQNSSYFRWYRSSYSCSSTNKTVTCQLHSPKRCLVRLVVGKVNNSSYSPYMVFIDSRPVSGGSRFYPDDLQEFFIEPSELKMGSDGEYCVTIQLKNIRLVSAEITNRPYEVAKPYCKFIGPTKGASGTTYIETNIKRPIKFTAAPYSYVQIYNENGVSENVDTHTLLDGAKTLTFSGSNNFVDMAMGGGRSKSLADFSTSGGQNFGHNLSVKKLKYNLTNAKLVSATLHNQLLRWYGMYEFVKDEVNGKGIILNDSGHATTVKNNAAEKYSDPCISTSKFGTYSSSDDVSGFYFGTTGSASIVEYKDATSADISSHAYSQNGYKTYSNGCYTDKYCFYGCGIYECGASIRCPSGYAPILKPNNSYSNYPNEFVYFGLSSSSGLSYMKRRYYNGRYYDSEKYPESTPNQTFIPYKRGQISSSDSKYYQTKSAKTGFSYTIEPILSDKYCVNGCELVRGSLKLTNGCYKKKEVPISSPIIKACNFHPTCYGIQKGKFIMSAGDIPELSKAKQEDLVFKIYTSGNKWTELPSYRIGNLSEYESYYEAIDFSNYALGDSDNVSIFTGKIAYKSREDFSYQYTTKNVIESLPPSGVSAYYYGYGDGGGCGSHNKLGSCNGCSDYTCYIKISCPSGFDSDVNDTSFHKGNSGLSDKDVLYETVNNTGGGWYTLKPKRNEMALITCTNGCYVDGYHLPRGCVKYAIAKGNCTKYYDPAGKVTSNSTCNTKLWRYEETSLRTYSSNLRYNIYNFFFLNDEEKTLQGTISSFNNANLMKNKGIYSYGNYDTDGDKWLCFCGDGNLEVEFQMKKNPSVTCYNERNTKVTQSFTSQRTITVSPDTHTYEKQSNGTYRVRIDFIYTELKDVKFVINPGTHVCIFKDLEAPKNSRVVLYENSGKTDLNAPSYTDNTQYYGHKNAWCYRDSNWNTFNLNNYPGEFFHLTDDTDYDYAINPGDDRICSDVNTMAPDEYLGRGLYRYFRHYSTRNDANSFQWSVSELSSSRILPVLMTGITLPINAALYYGASGAADHVYEWQSARNETWNETSCGDATAALRRLAVDAMQKLKTEYGENLRIYVVLYRKQPGDYSYLYNNAFNVLDVGDEKDLKKVLEAIATEIKEWADYKEADFVANVLSENENIEESPDSSDDQE